MAAAGGGGGQASQIYRLTNLGKTLEDSLADLVDSAALDQSLADKVTAHFDRVRPPTWLESELPSRASAASQLAWTYLLSAGWVRRWDDGGNGGGGGRSCTRRLGIQTSSTPKPPSRLAKISRRSLGWRPTGPCIGASAAKSPALNRPCSCGWWPAAWALIASGRAQTCAE